MKCSYSKYIKETADAGLHETADAGAYWQHEQAAFGGPVDVRA